MAVVGSMVTFRPRANLAARMGVSSCAALVTKLSSGCASLMVYPKGERPFEVYGVRLDAALSVEHSFAELGAGAGGGGAVAMPSGALGIWYADQYAATSRKVIPNSIAGTPSSNLTTAPRMLFNNSNFWNMSGATVTEANATDWNGSLNKASTIVGTGFWYLRPNPFSGGGQGVLSAGRYTIAIWVKRAAAVGVDQQFRMSIYNTLNSGTLTATSTWQRFAYCFTWGGGDMNIMSLRSFDDATGASLEISDAHVFLTPAATLGVTTSAVGATVDPGGAELPAGHMYVGRTQQEATITYGSGVLDMSAGSSSNLVQFGTPQTLTAYTAICVANHVADTTTSAPEPFFSKIEGFDQFSPSVAKGASPDVYWNGIETIPTDRGLWDPATNLNRWEFFAQTFDGSNHTWTRNDFDLVTAAQAGGSVSIQNLFVNAYNGGQGNSGAKNKFFAWALYPFALTKTQRAAAFASLQARMAGNTPALTVNSDRILVSEGHSLMYSATFYPYVTDNSSPAITSGALFARQNATLTNNSGNSLTERAAALNAVLPSSIGSRKCILTVMIGVNDYTLFTTSAWLTALAAYLDARRAEGWKVVLQSNPDSDRAGFSAWAATVDAATSGWVGTHCDAYADYRATVIGTAGSSANTTYFTDGTHLTTAGYDVIKPIYLAAVNSIP
jgi:lysophospholipase L1-like esterase